MKAFYLFFSVLLSITLVSCNRDNEVKAKKVNRPNAENDRIIREQFIRANQQLTQKQADEMDNYAKMHRMPFIKTPSGILYFVYKPSLKGDSITQNMEITMNYTVKLLDGTPCYSSTIDGPKTFIVGHADIESGIHKGVEYLKRGDKAIFLIPSVLAHGLLGDMNKIPPQMPIMYDVEIL